MIRITLYAAAISWLVSDLWPPVAVAAVPTAEADLAAGSKRPNVLFIAVDDLRPELNCYGASHIHSPNLDKLATTGFLFTRAYCQQAVCGPSRASLMTGMRSGRCGVINNQQHFRDTVPDVVTLPQHFRQQGYHTEGMGKLYHATYWDSLGVESSPAGGLLSCSIRSLATARRCVT